MAQLATIPGAHMPFAATEHGESVLLCALHCGVRTIRVPARIAGRSEAQYVEWRLHWTPLEKRRMLRIETGLPPASIECAPFLYRSGGDLVLGFMGQVPAAYGLRTAYYECRGQSLGSLQPAVEVHRRGACVARGGCWEASSKGSRIAIAPVGETCVPGLAPARLAPVWDNPAWLLASGMRHGIPATFVLDTDTLASLGELTIAGNGVYKPTVLGTRLFYTVRGHAFDDRSIVEAPPDWQLAPPAASV